MTQYGECANELGMSVDQLQALMLCLANLHQVSACPISLPEPVYLADELAKRGRDVYTAYK